MQHEFTLSGKKEFEVFENYLAQYSEVKKCVALRRFLVPAFDSFESREDRGRLMACLVDLQLTYCQMDLDFLAACRCWGERFTHREDEPPQGSVLDSFERFEGKLDILRSFNAFTLRVRAFWDKMMGFLVLYKSPEEYDAYVKSKSRKKRFRKISLEWGEFPQPLRTPIVMLNMYHPNFSEFAKELLKDSSSYHDIYVESLLGCVSRLDDGYRTAESHGSGVLRKYSLSMLPLTESKDFRLKNHWNYANGMMQGVVDMFAPQ